MKVNRRCKELKFKDVLVYLYLYVYRHISMSTSLFARVRAPPVNVRLSTLRPLCWQQKLFATYCALK